MKLTAKQALDLLKATGLNSVELVDDEAQSDYITTKDNTDPDKVVSHDGLIRTIDAAREPIILQKVLPGKETEINGKVAGKINNAIRTQLHELTGIPKADLEGKDSKEAATLAFAHWSKTSGGDKEAFAQQLKDVMTAHATEKQTLLETEGNKFKELESKYIRKQTMDNLMNVYNEAKGINPKANKAILANDFLTNLENEAIVKYNETSKEFELYDKANPSVRLLDASKNSFLKINDKVKEYHSARDQWNEDNRAISAEEEMKKRNANQQDQFTKDGQVLSKRDANANAINNWLTEAVPAA